MVKELRERTGAPMMQCKSALQETAGSVEDAIELLRKKGLAAAAKKSGRIAAEGAVGSYIHAGGKIGVLIEVNCETDFVGRTDGFQQLVRDLAMHVAAAEPRFVRREEVTEDVLEQEREIYSEQVRQAGKPDHLIDRIVTGKMEKFFSEAVLLEQPFIKNPDQTVGQMIAEAVATLGENIQVRRFARYKLGEGIEKKKDDFAAEVASQVAAAAS
jgi:elongation factor Ts